MFINYLTLSIVTAAATFALGAWFLLRAPAPAEADSRAEGFAFAFGAAGLILTITGLHLTLRWPLPGGYNIVFGEPLLYFGVLLLVGSAALGLRRPLSPLLVLGAFGGLVNVVLAVTILRHGMTRSPPLGAAMYLTSGLGLLLLPAKGRWPAIAKLSGALFVVAAILFAVVGYGAYIEHPGPKGFGPWVPAEMRGAPP